MANRTVEGFGGLELAVQDHGGDAPVVVLVHGYPDNHSVWDLVAERLRVGHRVISYDVRGAGASAVPADRSGYRLEALVGDLFAVVDAVSPGEPVHLVAHDWGSIQAWSAVVDPRAAGRIASYTSMSGPGLDHVARWIRARRRPGNRRWSQAFGQALHSWYIYLFHTPLAPWAWRRFVANRWPELLRRREPVVIDEAWPGTTLADDAVNGLELYRANMFSKLRPADPVHTEVPVQLVVPGGDPFVSPALLDGIEEIAPNLVRRDVGGGHWIPRSEPDLVAELVARFISSVDPAGRV